MNHEVRLLSKPVRLLWAGFESDTFALQRAGWSFAAQQNVYDNSMRLAMRHEKMRLTGISQVTEWEFSRGDHWHMAPRPIAMGAVGNVCVFRGDVLESEHARIAHMPRFDPAQRHAIDCVPQICETQHAEPLADLLYFAPIQFKQVILPPETVPDLMARILELQRPMREEHFLDQARRGATVHAQLVSLAG